jgi:hypothetical protein
VDTIVVLVDVDVVFTVVFVDGIVLEVKAATDALILSNVSFAK